MLVLGTVTMFGLTPLLSNAVLFCTLGVSGYNLFKHGLGKAINVLIMGSIIFTLSKSPQILLNIGESSTNIITSVLNGVSEEVQFISTTKSGGAIYEKLDY